jgi:hypothetical protein
MWFAYLYRRSAEATIWLPDPDEVAAATTEAECVTGILEPPWDVTYELGVDTLPDQIPDIRPQVPAPVPRLFARLDTADWTGQTYEYVGVVENPTAPPPQPPNPLPRLPLEEHSVQAMHLLPPVGTPGQLLALNGSQELSWLSPGTIALEDGSVTNAKLAPNAVTADKIADGTITAAELAPATITADKLAPGVIPPAPGAATEASPGLVELASTAEVQAGTDTTRAISPGRLVARTATETRTGLVELATTGEAVAGTDTSRAVTPAGLAASIAAMPAVPPASEATAGILRLATQAEVTTGTDDTKAVTPLKLAGSLVNATETQRGLLELATTAEVTAGATDLAAVTPLKLQQKLTAVLPGQATETAAGLLEVATTAETTTGTDDQRAITPLKLQQRLAALPPVPAATETTAGVLELATTSEVTAGSTDLAAVTPLKLQQKLNAAHTGTPLSLARFTASGTTLESLPVTADVQHGRLGLGVAPTAAPLVLSRAVGQRVLLFGEAVTERYGLGVFNAQMQLFAPGASAVNSIALGMMGADGSTFSPQLMVNTQSGLVGLGTNIGTTGTTLGSGASYQALSVKGSTLYVGQSSVQERPMTLVDSAWATSTDASRKARLTLSVYDHLAAREGLRLEADGTAARLGFYGSAAVAKPTVAGSRGGNAALASLLTALSSVGLVVDSSTA